MRYSELAQGHSDRVPELDKMANFGIVQDGQHSQGSVVCCCTARYETMAAYTFASRQLTGDALASFQIRRSKG